MVHPTGSPEQPGDPYPATQPTPIEPASTQPVPAAPPVSPPDQPTQQAVGYPAAPADAPPNYPPPDAPPNYPNYPPAAVAPNFPNYVPGAGAPNFPNYAPGAAPVGYPPAPVSGPGYQPYPPAGGLPPTSALPMVSGVPAAGYGPPPGYAPASGVPAYDSSGYPAGGAHAPTKKSRAALVLGLLAVVFFLATAVLAPLYIIKSGDYDKKTTAAKHQAQADQATIADLKSQLKSETDKYDELNQKQSGTQNQLDEITKEKQVISQCIDLQDQAVAAYLKGDKATYTAKSKQAQPICDEAQKYLD